MKLENIVTVLLIVIILTSCAPVAKVVSTETAITSSTFTPISSTPSITPTITPENISDAEDLSIWVDEFVFAYGEKVKVNSVEMDANQLANEIRKNSEKFMVTKQVNGVKYLLLVVNDVPLAVRQNEKWQKVTLKLLGNFIGVTFGTETGENFSDIAWQKTLYENFDSCVIGTGIYWTDMEQEKGEADFSRADSQYKWLSKGNCRLRGFLPIGDYPNWLLQGNYFKDELTALIRERITALMTRYPEIKEWIVVNEPYLPQYREDDPFYKAWGGYDYIITAIEIARGVNPNAILIYNDSDNHWRDGITRDLTRKIVSDLKEKGLVDAVGFQMHLYEWENGLIDNRQLPTIANELKFYKDLDVPVKITELDYLGSKNEINMSADDFKKRLASVYERVIEISLSNGITDITFWGLNDKYSWLNTYDPSLNGQRVNGTLFDENSRPKMAYYAVIHTLYRHMP